MVISVGCCANAAPARRRNLPDSRFGMPSAHYMFHICSTAYCNHDLLRPFFQCWMRQFPGLRSPFFEILGFGSAMTGNPLRWLAVCCIPAGSMRTIGEASTGPVGLGNAAIPTGDLKPRVFRNSIQDTCRQQIPSRSARGKACAYLALRKNEDRDLPIYKQAKAEHAVRRKTAQAQTVV